MQVVGLPAELVVEDEIVVGPLQTASESRRDAVDLIILVGVLDLVPVIGVGLTGVVSGQVERRRLLAEEPGLDEVDGTGGIVRTVGLEPQGQGLGITQGHGPPGAFLEEPLDGEVVEADAYRTYEGVTAPSSGQLELRVGFLGHVVGDVHRVVYLVGDDRVTAGMVQSLLGVEVAHGGYLPERALQHRLAVEVSLVGIEGVYVHELLLGVTEKSLLKIDHIVHVALLDHEYAVELIGRIEGVSGPGDVAEIVALALVDDEVYAQPVLLYIISSR